MKFVITKTYNSVTVFIVSNCGEELVYEKSYFSSVEEYDDVVISCMESAKIKLINQITVL